WRRTCGVSRRACRSGPGRWTRWSVPGAGAAVIQRCQRCSAPWSWQSWASRAAGSGTTCRCTPRMSNWKKPARRSTDRGSGAEELKGEWERAEERGRRAQEAVQEAGRQRERAEERELDARQKAYAMGIGLAANRWASGQTGLLAESLNDLWPAPDEADLRGFAWRYLWRQAQKERFLRGHSTAVRALAFSPDGQLAASGSDDGTIKVWEVR